MPDQDPPQQAQDGQAPVDSFSERCRCFFLIVWSYFAVVLGSIGAIASVVALFIPGKVRWLSVNKRPAETIAEKSTTLVTFLVVALAGIVLTKRGRKGWEAGRRSAGEAPRTLYPSQGVDVIGGAVERFGFPRRFEIRGFDALFERDVILGGGRNAKRVTEVTVRLVGRCPGSLKIFQKGLTATGGRIFGASLFRSRDKLFDSLYGIYAEPESLAEQIFASDRISSVVASVRRLGTYVDPLIDLSRDRLLVQVSESLDHERGVLNLIATATDFVGYVLDLRATDGMSWNQLQTGAGGHCPVCNAPLEAGIVYCLACRTPHHEECWDYLQKCSIFGCGATETAQAPQQ